MGVFTRSRHFVGAYLRGRHVNGLFFHNHELFHYKTNLYIHFYDPISGDTINNSKYKLDWNKWYSLSDLSFNLPSGYSKDPINFLPGDSAKLGVTGISDNINKIYVNYAVIPITGQIKLIYETDPQHIINKVITKNNLGHFFDQSLINKYMPKYFTDQRTSNYQLKYTTQPQSITITVKYQPAISTIHISVINQDGTTIGSYDAQGYVGTIFNLLQYMNNLPSNCIFQSMDGNPSTFTINDQSVTIHVNQPDGTQNLPAPSNTSQATIVINYVDTTGKNVGSQTLNSIPGSPFDIEPYEIGVPDGYEFSQVTSGGETTLFPSQSDTTTITIQVTPISSDISNTPTPDNPEPPLPSPSEQTQDTPTIEGYRAYCDTDPSISENPATYSDDLTERQQGRPDPITNYIRIDQTPTEIPDPDTNGAPKYSDVNLSSTSLILGPNNGWDPYEGNLSYFDMYDYKPDTTQSIETTNDSDGHTLVVIPVKPAYIHGITIQIAIPDSTGDIHKNLLIAPNQTDNLPNGWGFGRDEFTHQRYFVVPYHYKTTEYKLMSQIWTTADSNGYFHYHGNRYLLSSNRTITFSNPYDYMFYCKEK